jgi:hypothetical protein
MDIAGAAVLVEGERYELANLPPDVVGLLALRGLRTWLVTTDDRAAAFAKLLAWTAQASKRPRYYTGPWQKAIAAALVEETKNAAEPLTEATAASLVKAMSRKKLEQARLDPLVIKLYRKITDKKSSLYDVATKPEAAEPTPALAAE